MVKIISIMPGHNATVALFNNNNCVGIFHEEKFLDIKNFTGFPTKSFEHVLAICNNEFDKIVFSQELLFPINLPSQDDPTKPPMQYKKSFNPISFVQKILERTELITKTNSVVYKFRNFYVDKFLSPRCWSKLLNFLKKEYNISSSKILSFDHHLCHCVTPVAFFELEQFNNKTLLFSMDGSGDKLFAKVCIFDPKEKTIKTISQNSFQHSLGLYYLEMTKFLGMKPNEHEYKVMGLSAYVDNEKYYKHLYDELSNMISFNSKTLLFKSKINASIVSQYFDKKFKFERFDNLAAAIQKLSSELITLWISAIINKTGISDIACSGGVFMNVKINREILDLKEVKTAYFQPSCGDDSLSIGAAYLANKELSTEKWVIR